MMNFADHGHHLRSSIEINCSTGTLVRPTDQHNLSYYASFTAAGRNVPDNNDFSLEMMFFWH